MSRLSGLITTLFLTLMLAGCNTLTVDIIVSDSVTQNAPFSYEAIADPEAVGQVAYEWYLDGAIISSMPIDNAVIATAGAHTLSVKITDEEGETGEAEIRLDVIAAEVLNDDFTVDVTVLSLDRNPIADTTVSIDGIEAQTSSNGIAEFTGLTQTPVLVVAAEKDGFIPQSYRFEFTEPQNSASIELVLMEQAEPVTFNNDSEVTIESDALNTRVTLPAGSFIDTDGDPVTGEITATITPVDTRDMGASYLGGGVALTEESEVVQLLSLGMIDFEFTQNGEPVQLAAAANAQIEMDLVTETGPDGRVYAIGEEIEMWWFDKASGLWVEEGVGEIVSSATSPTGMKLVATVQHFTTWNWDYYKAADRASFTLSCTLNSFAMEPGDSCTVSLSGNGIYRSINLGSAGVEVINVAPDIALSVYAQLRKANGSLYTGTTSFVTSSAGSDVVVDLDFTPENSAYLSCFVTDGNQTRPVECFGSILNESGSYIGDIESNNTDGRARVKYITGQPLNLLMSLQGNIVKDTIDTTGINRTIYSKYVVEQNIGQLSCYATLDGSQGEYYPCSALVTSDTGKNTIVRAGDFSGSPLTAPISYGSDASNLTVAVETTFNDGKVKNVLVQEPEYFYYSPYAGERYSRPTTEPVVVSVTNNAESKYLYDYTCRLDGETIDPDLCRITYENRNTGEEWASSRFRPSWMEGKILIEDDALIDPRFIYATVESDRLGYYSVENRVVDTVRRTIELDLIFQVPQ